MADIDVFVGETVPLSHNATDGNTGLYSRATIFNGGMIPISAINLDHKMIGLYRADHAALSAGNYVAVYRFFTDAARTTKADYQQNTDKIRVRDPVADGNVKEEAMLGVSYDGDNDTLLTDVYLLRNGQTAFDVISCTADFYDADDNLVFSLSDDAPDGEAIFRMTRLAPGLVEDALYNVQMSIVTPTRTVVGSKGFKVIA
jgi:hypothetical protein